MLRKAIRRTFDLRPSALIRDLKLRRPIYAPLAAYGHFGRADTKAPWEETEANETALLIATLDQMRGPEVATLARAALA